MSKVMSPLMTESPADRMTVRDIEPHDLDTIVEINNGALEGVGPLDRDKLATLVTQADDALVLDDDDDGDVAGFVITLPSGAGYDSSRYDWFEARLDDYVYLDRIVVAPTHRRQGVASRLYDVIEGEKPVALEVYDHNDASLTFHEGRGFEAVGELEHAGTTNIMFVREPDAA